MARALWKGTLNFGLVAMPVELISIDHSEGIDLDMLDKRDNARIHFKRVNASTGKEVTWKNIVKGYKNGGDYVLITDADFAKANVKATQTIDILNFVNLSQVPVMYFEKPYYLRSMKGGDKPYTLLHKTLLDTEKVGIATVVIRKKQHLAAVMPQNGLLVLEVMRFPKELKDAKSVDLAPIHAKVSAAEVKMAKELVASMTTDWKPAQYTDSYHDDLMKMIRYKIKHGHTETAPDEIAPDEGESDGDSANVVDLMPLLRKSLSQKGRGYGVKAESKSGAKAASRTSTRKRAFRSHSKRRAAR